MSEELRIPFDSETVSALWNPAADPKALLIVAHGSGAGKDHPFMSGFATALPGLGISTLRFNFPYMDAGKKFPDRAPRAVEVWKQVREWVAENLAAGLPVFAAGKSFGGRMASAAVAEGMQTPGLIFLGYPLHAPKKTGKLRDEHLYGLDTPMLFLQGTKDPFATPQLLEDVVGKLGARATLHWIEGGDHSFKTAYSGRTVEQDGAQLAEPVLRFIDSILPTH